MNGFDLRAIGWIVTRDTCFDLARRAAGRRVAIDPAASCALARAWGAVEAAYYAERGASMPALLMSGTAQLSQESTRALKEFVRELVSRCPDRYAPAALRSRMHASIAHACVGGSAGMVLTGLATNPLLLEAGIALLAMGLWYAVKSSQLWCAHRVVDRFAREMSAASPLAHVFRTHNPSRFT